MSAVTIKDVAARAGVSAKTVSRVMNGEAYVRDHVRDAVMKVVSELSYRPNTHARSLSSSRSFLIVLFFDDPASGYAADVQMGAITRCGAHRQVGGRLAERGTGQHRDAAAGRRRSYTAGMRLAGAN
jgi:LacI family transcriptional regulator